MVKLVTMVVPLRNLHHSLDEVRSKKEVSGSWEIVQLEPVKIKLTHLGFYDWHVDWETYECMSSFGVNGWARALSCGCLCRSGIGIVWGLNHWEERWRLCWIRVWFLVREGSDGQSRCGRKPARLGVVLSGRMWWQVTHWRECMCSELRTGRDQGDVAGGY